jgi:hypothetical protein
MELYILLSNYSTKLLLVCSVLNILQLKYIVVIAYITQYNDHSLVELKFITFTIQTTFGIQFQYLVRVPNI